MSVNPELFKKEIPPQAKVESGELHLKNNGTSTSPQSWIGAHASIPAYY